jgi:hypothetical protein
MRRHVVALALHVALAGAVRADEIPASELDGKKLLVEGLAVAAPTSGSWSWTGVDRQKGENGVTVRTYRCKETESGAEVIFQLMGPTNDTPATRHTTDGFLHGLTSSLERQGLTVGEPKVEESAVPRASSFKWSVEVTNPKTRLAAHFHGYLTKANSYIVVVLGRGGATEPGHILEMARSLRVTPKK